MISFNTFTKGFARRRLLKGAALGLGSALFPSVLHAQQAVQQLLKGASRGRGKGHCRRVPAGNTAS